MTISSKDVVSLSRARANLTELIEEIRLHGTEKIITKNGESCAALIDAERLDHYHRLERELIHVTLLSEAIRGLSDLKEERTLSLSKLKVRHGR